MAGRSSLAPTISTMLQPTRSKLIVVVDSREQLPWSLCYPTVTRALAAGDYSIVGLEAEIAIERKSLGDYVDTVIHEWMRFRKELNRLGGYSLSCIVVEGSVQDVMDHRYESDAIPDSVLGRTHSIFCDHGVPVFWWGHRSVAIHMTERLLWMAWKRYGDGPGTV